MKARNLDDKIVKNKQEGWVLKGRVPVSSIKSCDVSFSNLCMRSPLKMRSAARGCVPPKLQGSPVKGGIDQINP